MLRKLACLIPLIAALGAASLQAMPVKSVTKQPDGVLFTMQPGILRLQVMSDNTIHATYAFW